MVTVLLLAAGAVEAQAQPAAPARKTREKDLQQAKALYDEGLRHYNVAEYAAAIEAFKQAYLLSGDPELLFDVGQAYRLSGDCEQALRFYKNFLRENPHATNTAEVDAAIARCEKPAPAPAATAPPPMERPLPAIEPPPPAPVPAPALAPAAPVDLRRAGEAPPQPGRNKRVAGVAVALVGAGAAGTGVVLGLSARSRLDGLHRQGGEWTPADQQSEQSAKRMASAGQILTGVGATAVVAGVALYLLGAAERRSSSTVAVTAGPGTGAVVWTCAY